MDKSKLLDLKPIHVELDKLKLDLTNVRYVHLKDPLTEEKVEETIWKSRDTRTLYEQIKDAKGVYEEPVISQEYVVIEGNRRIVCLRRLKKEAHEDKLPAVPKNYYDFVNCKMIPPNATPIDVKLFLASIHVKGRKEWPTFNRAKQIYDLHNLFNRSYDFLARVLGMGKITLIRQVDVYEQTKNYGERYKQDKEWYRKFTYFEELYKRKELKEFRKLQKNVDTFADWVFHAKFKDVRDVRALARVLEDNDALRVLNRETFDDALKIVERKNPALKSRVFKRIGETTEIIRSFPRRELIRTVNDPARRKMLEELKKEVDALLQDVYAMEKKAIEKKVD